MRSAARESGPRAPVLAPDDDPRAAAGAVLAFHARAFLRAETAARRGDVEAIHQLRVATRRLRAALRLFAPVVPANATARDGLSWLGRAIGEVRDVDVLAEALGRHGRRLEPVDRAALAPLVRSVSERRAVAHAQLLVVLDSARCRRLLSRLMAAEVTRPRRSGRMGSVAPELVEPLLRAVQRAGRRLDEHSTPEALHRLRVRAKRLRYALETLEGLGGKGAARAVARLERLQTLLGDHQDAVTQTAWLRAHAESDGEPAATLVAMGVLMTVLARRARKLRRRFPRVWRRFDRPRVRRRLGRDLAHGATVARPVAGPTLRLVRAAS